MRSGLDRSAPVSPDRVMNDTASPAPHVSQPRLDLHRPGREGEPVVVIDDYFPDPSAWVDIAAGLTFAPCTSHYPGHRAACPAAHFRALFAPLADVMTGVFGYRGGAHVAECNFSLVTREPSTLTPFQRLPHFDSFVPNRLAVLIYLSPDTQGGTAFYRHRATGFETLTPARHDLYRQTLDRKVAEEGLPPPRYPGDGEPFFEQIAAFEARYNRVLVYRGSTLHSGLIDDSVRLSPDPRIGRLTLNGFIDPA